MTIIDDACLVRNIDETTIVITVEFISIISWRIFLFFDKISDVLFKLMGVIGQIKV